MLPSEIAALKRQRALEARERAQREKAEAFRNFVDRRDSRRQQRDLVYAEAYDELTHPDDRLQQTRPQGGGHDDDDAAGDDGGARPAVGHAALRRHASAPVLGSPSLAPAGALVAAHGGSLDDAIDALCKLANDRVSRAAQSLEALRAGGGSSEEELDSEDEGEGEIKRIKAPVQRPKRWLSVLTAAREKIGIPAARAVSMATVVAAERKAIDDKFRATDRSACVRACVRPCVQACVRASPVNARRRHVEDWGGPRGPRAAPRERAWSSHCHAQPGAWGVRRVSVCVRVRVTCQVPNARCHHTAVRGNSPPPGAVRRAGGEAAPVRVKFGCGSADRCLVTNRSGH
jgi:hypothetical protein